MAPRLYCGARAASVWFAPHNQTAEARRGVRTNRRRLRLRRRGARTQGAPAAAAATMALAALLRRPRSIHMRRRLYYLGVARESFLRQSSARSRLRWR